MRGAKRPCERCRRRIVRIGMAAAFFIGGEASRVAAARRAASVRYHISNERETSRESINAESASLARAAYEGICRSMRNALGDVAYSGANRCVPRMKISYECPFSSLTAATSRRNIEIRA